MRSLISFFIGLGFVAVLPVCVYAASDDVTVYLFYGEGCPHCAKEEAFLDTIVGDGIARVEKFEVWHNAENLVLAKKVAATLGTSVAGVPFTVVKNKSFTGWSDDDTSAKQLVVLINALRGMDAPDVVAQIRQGNTQSGDAVQEGGAQNQTKNTQEGNRTGGFAPAAYVSITLLIFAAAGIGYAVFTVMRNKRK